jgi:small subunit ribosomal protein S5
MESTFLDVVVDVRRVTKVTRGGKRFAFSAFVVSGDKTGRVGFAIGKSRDVSAAIAKATARARKRLVTFPLRGRTVAYAVKGRFGSAEVVLCSAYKGTGVIAGGPVRAVMDALGIHDVLTKSFGSSNQRNVVKATFNALSQLRSVKDMARLRGKTIEEVIRGAHVQA